jgi:tRNA(Ile)-lysidine synthase
LKRIISIAAYKNGAERITKKQIDACVSVVKKGNGEVSLSGNKKFVYEFQKFSIQDDYKNESIDEFSYKVILSKPLTVNDETVIINVVPKNEYEKSQKINNLLLSTVFDCDIIAQELIIRNRRDGDVFSERGKRYTKKIKKIFNERKIPKAKRDSILILSDGDKIVWVDGFGVSEEYKVTASTENIGIIFIDRRTHNA